MSMERVIEALVNLGLTRIEAELYVYLSKKGPLNKFELKNSIQISENKLVSPLNNLNKKGLIKKSKEHPVQFFALTFEKAIEVLSEINVEKTNTIKKSKNTLMDNWNNVNC